MARAYWGFNSYLSNSSNGRGGGKWYSSKRITIIICAINIVVALYALHSLYMSLYSYPSHYSQTDKRYTPGQISKMEESIQLRKGLKPSELINLVNEIRQTLYRDGDIIELPQPVKRKIANEVIETLRGLNVNANASVKHEAVERWRKEKLKEVKEVNRGGILNSTIPLEEAGTLARALESDWAEVTREIGLWLPVEIINNVHDDKPEGEEDFDDEILPGKKLPPECNAELHTDYDGVAVRWGLTHPKESAYECCQACLNHAKNVKPGEMKCNVWVYCPSEAGCYSPDIYQHKLQECWLKYAENPRVNFKDKYSESYRDSHPKAPKVVPWVSGVIKSA